jgi:O-antigen/teichoic acid export membrane protein
LKSRLFATQLRTNMVASAVTSAINVGILAVGYPVYLYFLGYEQFGLWLVLASVLSLAQLGNLGVSQAMAKLVAGEYANDNIGAIRQYVQAAIAVLLLTGILALVVIVIFASPIARLFKLPAELGAVVISLLPLIGLLSLYAIIVDAYNSVLSGLGRMDVAGYCQTAGRAATLVVSAVLLAWGFGLQSLIVGGFVGNAVTHAMSVLFVRRQIGRSCIWSPKVEASRIRALLKFGGPLSVTSVLSMLWSPFNRMMLSRYCGLSVIPVYDLSFNTASQIRSLAESGIRPFMPEISSLSQKGALTMERIREMNRRAIYLILTGGSLLFASVILLAEPLLRLWLRDKYVEALPNAFRLMLVMCYISLINVPSYYTLLGLGRMRPIVVSVLVFSAGNALIVLAMAWMTQTVTVERISFFAVILSVFSSGYLVYVCQRVINGKSAEGGAGQ